MGLSAFYKAVKMYDSKKDTMILENVEIIETYKRPAGLVRKYKTETTKCTCSWYKNHFICRHQIFQQVENNLPIYQRNMFPELLILPHLKDVATEETNDVIDDKEDDIQVMENLFSV